MNTVYRRGWEGFNGKLKWLTNCRLRDLESVTCMSQTEESSETKKLNSFEYIPNLTGQVAFLC